MRTRSVPRFLCLLGRFRGCRLTLPSNSGINRTKQEHILIRESKSHARQRFHGRGKYCLPAPPDHRDRGGRRDAGAPGFALPAVTSPGIILPAIIPRPTAIPPLIVVPRPPSFRRSRNPLWKAPRRQSWIPLYPEGERLCALLSEANQAQRVRGLRHPRRFPFIPKSAFPRPAHPLPPPRRRHAALRHSRPRQAARRRAQPRRPP